MNNGDYVGPRRGKLRLFCIPHAGSGPSSFRNWRNAFGSGIELVPVAPPGREGRFAEPIPATLDELIQDLAHFMAAHLDLPFALLGHSMGALVAFELARWFRREKLAGPQHIFVSAHRAPHLPELRPMHGMPDALLQAELVRLQGTPSEVLQDSELLRVLLPVLRADLRLCENYCCRPEAPLGCAITCLGGDADRRVSRVQMVAWKRYTTGPFRVRLFPGGHFYLYENPALVGRAIMAELEKGDGYFATDAQAGGAANAG
jgi:medium-chain acyl-[acyl-carrier-protein] hydrolase